MVGGGLSELVGGRLSKMVGLAGGELSKMVRGGIGRRWTFKNGGRLVPQTS